MEAFKQKVISYTCGSDLSFLRDHFLEGFNRVFSFSLLDVFDEHEICRILRGDAARLGLKDLSENVQFQHGYNAESREVQMLFETVCDFTTDQQRLLVQFLTGYSQLPIGGLAALDPRLTVAQKFDKNVNPDDELPSVTTCMHYFKVPAYTSKDVMREKLLLAITEGQNGFGLT
jgi:E3 ubiquitin-protein ligase TRIP12